MNVTGTGLFRPGLPKTRAEREARSLVREVQAIETVVTAAHSAVQEYEALAYAAKALATLIVQKSWDGEFRDAANAVLRLTRDVSLV